MRSHHRKDYMAKTIGSGLCGPERDPLGTGNDTPGNPKASTRAGKSGQVLLAWGLLITVIGIFAGILALVLYA